MSFPEPKSFNGGPGETGGYIGRSTGPRRPPDPEGRRRCSHCTVLVHWTDRGGRGPIRVAGVGEFCSERCQQAAQEGAPR